MDFEFRELRAPFGVQIEITSDCNNCCFHCYNYWRDGHDVQEKPLDEAGFSKVVDVLAKEKVFYATITGGEPLVKKRVLYAVMDRLAECGIRFSLNSNLVDLTKDDVAVMKKCGLRSILTSIHSYGEDKHDKIANHPGSFNATVRNIRILVGEGFRVKANTVITQANYQDMFLIGGLLSRLGVSGFFATRFLNPVRHGDFSNINPNKKQIKEAFYALLRVEEELSIPVGSLVAYPHCFLSEDERFHRFAERSCSAGITIASIECTGYVRACPNSDIKYGHILDEGLGEAWKKMKPWRKGAYLPRKCSVCPCRFSCGGGCRVSGIKTGEMGLPDGLMNGPTTASLSKRNLAAPINIEEDSSFAVHRDIRYREEDFGFAVVGGKPHSPALVSKAVVDFLVRVGNKKDNTLREVLREWRVGLHDVQDLFSYLAEREVITIRGKERR